MAALTLVQPWNTLYSFSPFIKMEHKSQKSSPSQSEQSGCGAAAHQSLGRSLWLTPAPHSLQAEFGRPVNCYVAATTNTRYYLDCCYDLGSPGAWFLLDVLPAFLPPGKEASRQLVWPHFKSLPTPTPSLSRLQTEQQPSPQYPPPWFIGPWPRCVSRAAQHNPVPSLS